jgi:hypothetical protein
MMKSSESRFQAELRRASLVVSAKRRDSERHAKSNKTFADLLI